MAKQTINVGGSANDGTGDKIRVAFQKCNSNFDELYDGQDPANLISTDPDNAIELGSDGKLWSDGGGGGSVGTLQEVTDNGNRTTNEIISTTGLSIEAIASSGKVQRIVPVTGIGDDQNFNFPNKVGGGSIALTSDIPTVDATPTDGSSNAVSSNGVFDGLALKQNTLTETNFGSFINGLTAKNTLVDADEVVSDDSADSNKAKKTTWLNVWLNYLKPKADALYATISNLALKQDFATATTGAVISFAVPQVYNSVASPTASNITDNLTGAKIGIVQKIYSNKATEPTYPAGWVKLSGTYTNSVTNIIYCEWCEGSRVEYWIVEA